MVSEDLKEDEDGEEEDGGGGGGGGGDEKIPLSDTGSGPGLRAQESDITPVWCGPTASALMSV